jgi:hypothetical protein
MDVSQISLFQNVSWDCPLTCCKILVCFWTIVGGETHLRTPPRIIQLGVQDFGHTRKRNWNFEQWRFSWWSILSSSIQRPISSNQDQLHWMLALSDRNWRPTHRISLEHRLWSANRGWWSQQWPLGKLLDLSMHACIVRVSANFRLIRSSITYNQHKGRDEW